MGLSFDRIPKSTRLFTPDISVRVFGTVRRLLLGTSISSSQTLAFNLVLFDREMLRTDTGLGLGLIERLDHSHSNNLDTRMSVISITPPYMPKLVSC
jgi:hypothetical protein